MLVVPKYVFSLHADIYVDNYDHPDNPPPTTVAPFLLKVSRTDEGRFLVEGIDRLAGRTRFAVELASEAVDLLIDASLDAEVFKIVRDRATSGSAALEVGDEGNDEINVVVISDPNPGPVIGPKDMAFAMRARRLATVAFKAAKQQKRSASVAGKALARRRKKESKAG